MDESAKAWAEDEEAYTEYKRTGRAITLAAMKDWVKSWGMAVPLPPPEPQKLNIKTSTNER